MAINFTDNFSMFATLDYGGTVVNNTNATVGVVTSANATSGLVGVEKRSKLSAQLISTITSGTAQFGFQVSNNGTTWSDYNRLTSNVVNSNAQTDARVFNVTLSASGSAFVFFPDGDYFKYIRSVVVVGAGVSSNSVILVAGG